MNTLPKALQLAEQTSASAGAGIADLFGLGAPADAGNTSVAAELEPDWEPNERLAVEKKTLGLYLSGHPVDAFRGLIDQVCSGSFRALIDEAGSAPSFGGGGGGDDDDEAPVQRRRGPRRQVMLAGWLTEVRTIAGDRPGKILTLDDRTAQLVCWLDFQDWQRFQHMLRPDTLVFATGSVSASQREGRELEYRLSPRSFYDLDALMRERAERITLTWRKPPVAASLLPSRLAPWRSPHGAAVTVDYWNGVARAVLDFGQDWKLKLETAALAELRRLLGAEAVKVDYRRWVAPATANGRARAEYDDGE
jgi:DNA polymerase-3 subunit alpha